MEDVVEQKQINEGEWFPRQTNITTTTLKLQIASKCVNFCCMDIRPFETVAENGFIEVAQELINVDATHGRLSATSLFPDPTTISWKCKEMVTAKRGDVVEEIKRVMS